MRLLPAPGLEQFAFGQLRHIEPVHADAKLSLPVYLDADVQSYLAAIAARKGLQLSELANDLLKREIAIIEATK